MSERRTPISLKDANLRFHRFTGTVSVTDERDQRWRIEFSDDNGGMFNWTTRDQNQLELVEGLARNHNWAHALKIQKGIEWTDKVLPTELQAH